MILRGFNLCFYTWLINVYILALYLKYLHPFRALVCLGIIERVEL